LRFDFQGVEKLDEDKLKQVKDLVNKVIDRDLKVSFKEVTLEEAQKMDALALFEGRYDAVVKVYTVGEEPNYFSREVCRGPHVKRTGEIGHVKINKQEKIGAGICRIYAVLLR
jgi:alanyl-tRNA synthetase